MVLRRERQRGGQLAVDFMKCSEHYLQEKFQGSVRLSVSVKDRLKRVCWEHLDR